MYLTLWNNTGGSDGAWWTNNKNLFIDRMLLRSKAKFDSSFIESGSDLSHYFVMACVSPFLD